MQLILSISFLVLAIISWALVVAYFFFGIPIGLLFLGLSIWSFASWRYEKTIPFNAGAWLFPLPILGLLPLLIANRNLFGLNRFATTPPDQMPSWVPIVSLFNELILPAIWWGALLVVIIYFFRRARKIV